MATDREAGKLLLALTALEKMNQRPRPICRDCADEDGVCPTTGMACDITGLIAECRAALSPPVAMEAVPVEDVRLRAGVRQLTLALREKEWADLLTTDDDLADLEQEVGKLIGMRT